MDGHLDERALTRIKRSRQRITSEIREQIIIFRKSQEDLPMMPHSVVTIVDRRYSNRDHLAFGASQIGMTVHQFAIEIEVRDQRLGANAVYLQYVRHTPASKADLPVRFGQKVISIGFVYNFDEWH